MYCEYLGLDLIGGLGAKSLALDFEAKSLALTPLALALEFVALTPSLVKHIKCHVERENLVTFLDFRLSQGSVATYCCVHREFSYESPGERILKIGPHLPKLLSNIKQLTFLEHGVYNGYTLLQLHASSDVKLEETCNL